jgi:two-component system sensor histidine kinase VicK
MAISTQSKSLIKSRMFTLFTGLIFSFTIIIYVLVVVAWYLQYSGNIDIIYTTQITNVLIGLILMLFILGWFFSYCIYTRIIKPSYEAFNIISEIVNGIAKGGDIDHDQVEYLQEFMANSLSQLRKGSITRKIDVSKGTEVYIKKLEDLTKQNTELAKSEKELSQLVAQLEKQQKLLQLERAKTTAIINAIPNGLLASSRDGNIFLVNEETEKLLGLDSDRLLGKFINQVLPLSEKSTTNSDSNISLSKVIQGERITRVFTYESPIDNQKITIENTTNPIKLDNDIVGIVDIIRDKTQEQETARAQKEFVSIASHQLRTPITSIKWNAELLLSAENLDPNLKDAVDDIYKENNRIEKLVNALLNLSRIDLGTIKFVTKKINIVEHIDILLKTLNSEIIKKNLIIQKDISIKTSIINDPIYIDIIIGNILSNAVKYTPLNGNIFIKVYTITENNSIHIEISDNGLGIPASQQSQIFGRLFRADNAKNSQPDGNGLGLYVVKKLVEAMSGNVWFQSEDNKGTTFFIELPFVVDNQNVIQ